MANFPISKEPERVRWSVWRDNKWLGEWVGDKPRIGSKIKPKECLTSKTVVGIDHDRGRILVK